MSLMWTSIFGEPKHCESRVVKEENLRRVGGKATSDQHDIAKILRSRGNVAFDRLFLCKLTSTIIDLTQDPLPTCVNDPGGTCQAQLYLADHPVDFAYDLIALLVHCI